MGQIVSYYDLPRSNTDVRPNSDITDNIITPYIRLDNIHIDT